MQSNSTRVTHPPAAQTAAVAVDPRARSTRGGWARVLAGAVALLTVFGVTAIFAPSASAALASAGPIDPASLFPSYYADSNGLQLQLCQDGLPNCLAGPEQVQDIHAAGGDAEAFYFHASNDVAGFTLEAALEAAYLADGPDQEMTFMRTQATGKNMTPNGKYTFTDPYGTYTCTADATGLVQPAKGCRFETGAIPGNFNAALGGRLGPFLTWDTFGSTGAGAPPAGFIGDNATPHAVVGSPTGFNKMRVSGPGITGTCTNDDGSTVANCQETDKIIIQGKVQPGGSSAALSAGTLDFGDIAATPPVTKTLTYANTGSAPVTISSVGVSGTGAAAFGVTNNCPVAPATVDVGTRCTIGVTFTPDPGKSSAATLTVNDDTAAATRTVALKGSNLGVMYVADPVPPAGLVFPSTPVTTTSSEDNVVIGNSGNGPLTIPATGVTITGASAAQYKLGPNNTCTGAGVTVAPDGGCEIGVQFKPTTTGSKTANLRVTDSNGKIVNIPLTGTAAAAVTDTTAPTAPRLTGSLAGTTANLSWSGATDAVGVTAYQVFRNGTQVGANLPATTTTFSDANLAAGTYSYTVKALDGAGNASVASNAVSLTVVAPDTTAPTVTAQSPAANATGVAVTANATATFSENVSGVSGTSFTLKNTATGAAVTAAVTYNATTRVATLDPGANLANNTQYTATLTGGATAIRDAAGNALVATATQPLSWSFTTAPAAGDTTAPTVTTRAPADNATAIAVGANVTATFSEAAQGVDTNTFQLKNPAGQVIAATVTNAAGTNRWVLNPTANLVSGTRYTATLTGATTAIRDLANNALVGTAAQPLTWSFTTAGTAPATGGGDTVAPTVTARAPAVNATGVAVAANVTATFSEAVQGVGTATFQLKNPAGQVIAATVTQAAGTNRWVLNPNASLARNTLYTVTVTGGATAIRDAAGNAFATTTWTFRTVV